MLGTAFPAARLLLIEQSGPWGRTSLRDSRFPLEVSDVLLGRAGVHGVRVQTIRPVAARSGVGPPRWALVDTRPDRQAITWGRFADPIELLDLSFDETPTGSPDAEPVFLVCTHGKHDPCCAVRGRPVAAALDRQLPGRVWETSHVGGDRFAANVLVLPTGVLYGRVAATGAAELVDATDEGAIVLPLYRGQVGLVPVAQAALAFGFRQTASRHLRDLSVVGVYPIGGSAASTTTDSPGQRMDRVELAGRAGRFRATVRTRLVPADGLTCAAPGPASYARYDLDHWEVVTQRDS